MSEIIVLDDGSDETAEVVEETTEAIVDVAEAVAEAIVDAVEEINEESSSVDTATVAEVAFDNGVSLAMVLSLTERVQALETRLIDAETTANIAVDIAMEVATEPELEEVEETTVEPDEGPTTRRTRFNKFWFGS